MVCDTAWAGAGLAADGFVLCRDAGGMRGSLFEVRLLGSLLPGGPRFRSDSGGGYSESHADRGMDDFRGHDASFPRF